MYREYNFDTRYSSYSRGGNLEREKDTKIIINNEKIILKEIDIKTETIKTGLLNNAEKSKTQAKGKNGCGKSTLLNLIAGINKPSSGYIFIDGIDIFKRKNLRKEVGIVFQNPDSQILFPKVSDDIEFALKNLKLENKNERIKNALKKVNLSDKEKNDTYNLSLGQKQRVNIASVLAINPNYILLDEPTTMIDSKEKNNVYKIMKQLKKDRKTIIFVTNNINEILLADRILILENKIIKHIIKKNELLENIQVLQECDIIIPDVIQIILKLNESGKSINLEEWTINEMIDEIVKVCNS